MLVGRPGVGKSLLARTLLDEMAGDSRTEVVWVVGSATDPPIPFGAFAPLVWELGSRPGRQPDPLYMLQSFRTAISRRALGRRLIVGVDDAHLLDSHSATLLFQLVADGTATAVVCRRAGDSGPLPLQSLWKDRLVERIDVGPLDREAASDLLRLLLSASAEAGGPAATSAGRGLVDGELDETLWKVSEGNALYLRELVLAGVRCGCIASRDGMWHLAHRLDFGPRLSELIEERLRQLDAPGREAMELLAMADPMPLTVLERLVSPGTADSLHGLGLIETAGAEIDGAARSGHALFAEVIRTAMTAPRRVQLSRILAEAFTAEGLAERELLRILAWRLDGRDRVEPGKLLEGAGLAAARQDWHLARRLAAAAVEFGGGTEARLFLAEAHSSLGDYEQTLQALAGDGETDDEVARTAVLRASALAVGMDRRSEGEALLAAASRRLSDPAARTWVEAVRAGLLSFGGRPAEALRVVDGLMERPDLDDRAVATLLAVHASGLVWNGQVDSAIATVARSGLAQTRPAGMTAAGGIGGWAMTALGLALVMSGRMAELETLCAERYRLAVQLGNDSIRGVTATGLGWSAMTDGRLATAAARFQEATIALEGRDTVGVRLQALLGLADVLSITGSLERASDTLDEARRSIAGTEELLPVWMISQAWLTAAQGSLSAAVDSLADAASAAARFAQPIYEAKALHAMARMGVAGSSGRLAELARVIEGNLVQIMAAHAAALDLPPGESARALDRTSARYADCGLQLYAAEAAAQASRAHAVSGDPRRASASAGRAQYLLPEADGARPLGLSLAMAAPALTRREREVASLAAQGISSSAIASRLCLSVRTVETHLARVYTKLGITGRSELAGALGSTSHAG
jgi:DNA-binding CsgD family transcriptional regulator